MSEWIRASDQPIPADGDIIIYADNGDGTYSMCFGFKSSHDGVIVSVPDAKPVGWEPTHWWRVTPPTQ